MDFLYLCFRLCEKVHDTCTKWHTLGLCNKEIVYYVKSLWVNVVTFYNIIVRVAIQIKSSFHKPDNSRVHGNVRGPIHLHFVLWT